MMTVAFHRTMMKFCTIVFFFLLAAPVASAQEPIKIYAYLLKDRLDAKGGMSYNQVLSYMTQDMREQIQIVPVPIRRGVTSFLETPNSCAFPTAKSVVEYGRADVVKDMRFVQTKPLDSVSVGLYRREGDEKFTSRDDVKGRVIGHLHGSVGDRLLGDINVTIRAVREEGMMARLLEHGRISAFIGHHPDTPMALDRLGITGIRTTPDVVLYKTKVHLVCHDFEGADAVMEAMNARITELHSTGKIRTLLGRHAEIDPL